ncbi:hypothetical protein [Sporomusa termitida]|uniref:Uncharacterized protein n=1 Tax=Sporomusa termitida TaxID=2377 RepID=A0A517DVE9_9FIRM|nr:hypothetical protein [Sporomusa termitida]QDR81318.1 hypothetical protein SPTER_26960 [Sporomusa termitida]
MEYILHNTDIFDEKINDKFSALIINNQKDFIKGTPYVFTVSFHINLLQDERFYQFDLPAPQFERKAEKKDKIYDVLSFQLKRLERVLGDNGIEAYSTTIQGDNLDAEDIIKLKLLEDTSEPSFMGRGKKKKRMKVSCIVPSVPYTSGLATKFASERISKIFYDFMSAIRSEKIMSEILGIEETNNEDVLFKAFAKQYGELWLPTDKRHEELVDRLKEKTLSVLEKYREIEEKTCSSELISDGKT